MSNQLTSVEAEEIRQLVGNSEHIVITSHSSPDGDAVGSSFALYHVLKSLGKNPVVILPDAAPATLRFLQDYDSAVIFQQNPIEATALLAKANLIFVLDYNHFGRVGSAMSAELESAKADFILIDHHQAPGSFAKVTYSDTASCSTAQLIYKTVVACGWKKCLNIAAAEGIYMGIVTDSGSFRFASVTKETHDIVGELIDLGLKHAEIHQRIYDSNSLNKLRLVGYALSERLEVLEDCATVIISLSKEELERFDYQPGDTESLVNMALSISGVKLSAFLREENDRVKISLRSKNAFDVNSFARKHWNGGGHVNAAGGSFQGKVQDALALLKEQCAAEKDQIINS